MAGKGAGVQVGRGRKKEVCTEGMKEEAAQQMSH